MGFQFISCLILKMLVLLQVLQCSGHPDELHQSCGTKFSCGPITEVGYPFRGNGDPEYCGYPNMLLKCNQDNTTTIRIMNVTYRVLKVDQTTQIMKIAREDVLDSSCPQELANTTFNYALFDYTSAYMNISFLYGCPSSVNLRSPYFLGCRSNEYESVYVVSGAQGPGNCNVSVVVPVLRTGLEASVNLTDLDHVLEDGFEVRWKVDRKECIDCTTSGGRCGYSFSTNQTTCICPDKPYLTDSCVTANRALPVPASLCQLDDQYVACGGTFTCANFQTLGYPFWGGNRTAHCGHPSFQLINCRGDVPLITFASRPYRVLGIDSRNLLITVARQDLWNNTCSSPIYNTSLDYRLFKHPDNDQNLTLSYGCTDLPAQQPFEFDCQVNGGTSASYFLTRAALLTPNANWLTCRQTITVPVNQTSAQLLTSATSSENDLQQVLAGGFGLTWDANETNCNECARSGGRCGYNSNTTSFACYCFDRPYPFECNKTDSGDNDKSRV